MTLNVEENSATSSVRIGCLTQ